MASLRCNLYPIPAKREKNTIYSSSNPHSPQHVFSWTRPRRLMVLTIQYNAVQCTIITVFHQNVRRKMIFRNNGSFSLSIYSEHFLFRSQNLIHSRLQWFYFTLNIQYQISFVGCFSWVTKKMLSVFQPFHRWDFHSS